MGDKAPQYVTHAEFSQFASSTNKKFDEVIHGLEKLRDSNAKPTNWGWWLAGFGALLALMTLRIDPLAEAINDIGSRLWNIETSRYSIQDGRDLRERMERRDEQILATIKENNDRAWQELVERAKWMGVAESTNAEQERELDKLWAWKDYVQPELSRLQEKVHNLEIRAIEDRNIP